MRMRRALQKGFTAIEMMVVLMVTVYALAKGGQELTTYIDNLEYQAVAQHANLIREAGNKYIKDNYAAIQAVATPASPATITVVMLQSTSPQYLDPSLSATNSFGQSYSILVLEPVAGQLEAMIVTTGGTAIPERGLRYIAQILGQQGGYVSAANTGVAMGLRGSWSKALPGNYGVSPGAGHLTIALFYGDSGTVSDFVYRDAVAGRPELNTMNVPLVMAATYTPGIDACTTVGAIARDSTGKVISCDGTNWKRQGSMYWEDPVANIAALTAITCNATTNVWQSRMVQTPTVGTGPRAYICDGVTWQPFAVSDNGNLTMAGNLQAKTTTATLVAVAGDSCAGYATGAQAQDASGSPLYCQSGSWVKLAAPLVGIVKQTATGRMYANAKAACDLEQGYGVSIQYCEVVDLGGDQYKIRIYYKDFVLAWQSDDLCSPLQKLNSYGSQLYVCQVSGNTWTLSPSGLHKYWTYGAYNGSMGSRLYPWIE